MDHRCAPGSSVIVVFIFSIIIIISGVVDVSGQFDHKEITHARVIKHLRPAHTSNHQQHPHPYHHQPPPPPPLPPSHSQRNSSNGDTTTTINTTNTSTTTTTTTTTPPPTTPSPTPWSSLEVDVTLDGQAVHLTLQEDSGFEPDVPVLELTRDESGEYHAQRALLGKAECSVYHDEKNRADFIVFREKDENGGAHYKMEGLVHLNGKVYNIKTTGRKLKHRVRRETSQNSDDVTDDDSNDVTHDDTKGEDGNKVEEEDEVEVVRYSSPAADQADYIPKPNVAQESRQMKTAEPTLPRPASLLFSPQHPNTHFPEPNPNPNLNPNPNPNLNPNPNRNSNPNSNSTPNPNPEPNPARSPSSSLPPPPAPKRRRRKRTVTQDIYIDVVALADYGIYTSWYSRSDKATAAEKKTEALENIRRYYAFVMDGVNRLYNGITSFSYMIHVKLTAVIVSTTASSAPWTETRRVSADTWDEVDAHDALKDLSSWVSTTDILPTYDHVMLFTGYDLTKTLDGGISDTITGLAYTATLCGTDGMASSVVEDLGGFQCVIIAAHELGHGISARHDGDANACSSLDRYIMTVASFPITPENTLHPWSFSSCSINYFNNFLTLIVRFSGGQTCLYNALTANSNIPDVTSQMPGQLYDVNEQCELHYGSGSFMCQGPNFKGGEEVCTKMYCLNPSDATQCKQLVAARGTTCGNYKWCESGVCVSNRKAPAVNENCVHGDQPGIAFNSKTCSDFVDSFPGYCYQEIILTRCCASCARHYRLVTGCEYGDNVTNCQAETCSSGGQNYQQSCCGTCNYGSTFTPTTTTTPTTTISTSPRTRRTTAAGGECTTDANVLINKIYTCSAYTRDHSYACYNATYRTLCCASCRQAATGVKGCQYGDKHPQICGTYGATGCGVNFPDGTSYNWLCCGTCITSCVDTLSGDGCASLSSSNRYRCYDNNFHASCCATCESLATVSSPDCRYGDRAECDISDSSSPQCVNKRTECCETCAEVHAAVHARPSTGGGQDVTPYVTAYVIVACVSLLLLLWSQKLA